MKKDLSKYKALVFDIDGTLYDYDKCNDYAYAKVVDYCYKKYHKPREQIEEMISKSRHEVHKNGNSSIASYHNRFLYFQDFVRRLTLKASPREVVKIYDLYNKSFYKQMTLYDGLTDYFKSGKLIGICTNMTSEVQYHKLIQLGVDRYIDCIVTSEDAFAEKPDKKIYEKIVSSLGVKFDECLFIGDNEIMDIDMPKSLGADAINIKYLLEDK